MKAVTTLPIAALMSLNLINFLPIVMADGVSELDSPQEKLSSKQLYQKSRAMIEELEAITDTSSVTEREKSNKLRIAIVEILMEIDPDYVPDKELISLEEALKLGLKRVNPKYLPEIISVSIERKGAAISVEFKRELPPRVKGSSNLGRFTFDGYTGTHLISLIGG